MTDSFKNNRDNDNPEVQVREDLLSSESAGAVDHRFVSAEAGDLDMTEAEKAVHERLWSERGRSLYTDMVMVLTNREYSPGEAERLWNGVLSHKDLLADRLGRNPGVLVGMVDYLVNIEKEDKDLSLISETRAAVLAEMALKDGLTELYDHATFQLKLSQEIDRFSRYGLPLSLVMADIDHFKVYNDTQGHQSGDVLLREMAGLLRHNLRKTDIAARYGGEEFALILPSTGIREALEMAERIRVEVEERWRDCGGITISMGVSSCPRDGKTRLEMVEKADLALYQAKEKGRNRIEINGTL
jgi:diguanylate cyclase (GGDEF)-like protein